MATFKKGDRVIEQFGDHGKVLRKLAGGTYDVQLDGKSWSALYHGKNLRAETKSNPAVTNRWGHTFKKGDVVQDNRGYLFRYVKLAKSDGFSRAYGRQAIVCHDKTGPLTEDMEVGLNDLRPVAKANPRYASGPYAERIKLPKWSGRPRLVEASAPRIRASFGNTDHEAAIEKAITHANAAARAYNRTMKAALVKYGEPRVWISGIGNESFPEPVKNLLRKQIEAFNRAQDAVALHYKALGKRTPLYKSAYVARMVKAGGYGLGGIK